MHNSGTLKACKLHEISKMSLKEINMLRHVDDGAILFNLRSHVIVAIKISSKIMAKWGLTMRIGHEGKNPKMELIFFPSTITIVR